VTALAVALTFVVLLLGVLVAGLLRSHADILRALHSLGAGIGDPLDADDGTPTGPPRVSVSIGPPLPKERLSSSAPDVTGTTLTGDAVAVSVTAAPHTLLAFLSSGCSTCAPFWHALRSPDRLPGLNGVRVVAVPKGAEHEELGRLRDLASPAVEVVLSTEAWLEYEVPGSPFFALVDGSTGRRVGEGLANTMEQVVDLVSRAIHDDRSMAPPQVAIAGPAREADNDRLLRDAGILPGDPSLYPRAGANGAPRR
jgi:hypothetical protein